MATRAAEALAARLEEMEIALAERDSAHLQQAREYAELKAQVAANAAAAAAAQSLEQEALDAQASSILPALPRPPVPKPQSLRSHNIEQFSGEAEDTKRFVRLVDERLNSTYHMDDPQGLEFAFSHFTGYAAVWWEGYSDELIVRSWRALRPEFLAEFALVDEAKTYQSRLAKLTQTGSVADYITEFLSIKARLPGMPDAYMQNAFADGICSYFREKFAGQTFESVKDMIRFTRRIVNAVDDKYVQPDVLTPVVAAMPARPRKSGTTKAVCYRCHKPGHLKRDCKVNLDRTDRAQGRQGGQQDGRATKGKVPFGKYDGSGRVHAIAASVLDEESDDDLRLGNGQA